MKKNTTFIRWLRIIKHLILLLISWKNVHWWEVEHYYYMEKFAK